MHVAAEHARWQGEGGDRGSDVELRQTLASLYRQATPASREDCAPDSRRPHHHRTEHYTIYRYCTERIQINLLNKIRKFSTSFVCDRQKKLI